MESSDDEAEAVPQSVSNYHFVDDKDEPISFHVLPIQWGEGETQDGKKVDIFVRGTADNGLQKLYKHVIAWRFDLSNVDPEISVLSKENNWLKLQKPRKSFEEVISSILITVQCLHYVRRNPETSGKSLWDHLSKVFSSYEVRPSQNDLVNYIPLISEAVKRDDALAKCKFLVNFLEEKPTKRKLHDEDIQATTKPGFIVDDTEEDMIDAEDESSDDDNLFDSVCAFCDNGGDLFCEGRCLRSFHATVKDGEDSMCETLGFTRDEVDAIQNFFCKNCQYKQHQCYACGKLGSSDKSSGAEVFPCVSATCGQFYHPRCIAKLIYKDNGVSAEELEKKIAMGESFTCPIHKCCICKQGENKKDTQLRFAVCRRCPKSYHRKCLPEDIVFEKTEKTEKTEEDEEEEDEEDEGTTPRAWEGLLPNRVLIYCTKHEIIKDIGTPIRDHVTFPDVGEKRTSFVRKKTDFVEKKKKRTLESLQDREKSVKNKRSLSAEEFCRGQTAPTISKEKLKSSSAAKVGGNRISKKLPSGLDTSRKVKANSALKKEAKISVAEEQMTSLGDQLYAYMNRSNQVKLGKQGKPDGECGLAIGNPASKTLISAPPSLDAATERRLLALMKDATSSITLEDVIRKRQRTVPSTHQSSSKNAVDRNITLGKVEGSVEAVRTALRKLEEGCSTEDSEAVCAPEVVHQIYKWKNKLRVYLAPFLHGMRYTSFGRHFTKVDKLEEIADRLHWYVKDGDTIVDFCCGANDFSIVMKKKLEETGKNCFYKNYDLIQPKNDFCFEKRDWMKVKPKELPKGSQLIMGLNPPFGVKAALANRFIDKALEFDPKLLILIVPPETQRLNEKKSPYDLIWEDNQFLSGKSFYLPGSVDVNDKQMDQWNVTPPPLYLWSRPDWSADIKAIAQEHGHMSASQGYMKDHSDSLNHGRSIGNDDQYGEAIMLIDYDGIKTDSPKDVEGGAVVAKEHRESSCVNSGDIGGNESPGDGNNIDETCNEILPRIEPAEKGDQHSEHSNSGSSVKYGTTYGGTTVNVADDRGRRSLSRSSDEPYSSLTHRWSAGPSSGYRATNLEEPFVGHMRDRLDTLGYRPCLNEVEDPFRRESDVRSQIRIYGQQDFGPLRSNYLVGQDSVSGQIGSYSSPYSHSHLGLTAESSYRMNTSAMQRYAPRLDELNHTRMGGVGSEPALGYEPHMFSSNGTFDPRAPRPGQHGGSMGFAPGPHQSYSNQNSAGWLNE
ncbi:hypothetical protein DVH24_004058 [Malus domestica]|uniref:Zinc finger PHD-type domain-containing protein n=1 Tax=Malus domestica TaxID=3750 RepID=A0A498K7P2_MALDO|nr:hypothetical protein DVH24_004058 [Malus domestica]